MGFTMLYISDITPLKPPSPHRRRIPAWKRFTTLYHHDMTCTESTETVHHCAATRQLSQLQHGAPGTLAEGRNGLGRFRSQHGSEAHCYRKSPWLPWSMEASLDMASSGAALRSEAQLLGGASVGGAVAAWLFGPSSAVLTAWVSASPSTAAASESVCPLWRLLYRNMEPTQVMAAKQVPSGENAIAVTRSARTCTCKVTEARSQRQCGNARRTADGLYDYVRPKQVT